ncbi:MAG TPA: oligoendopeptidase F [Candidatus Kapabacteria bacterium]|nr:oligoendopeptidase F [Candidatus Kapabacteria bacterium]
MRYIIFCIITLILGVNMLSAQSLPSREEIPDKYKWDLTHIYKTDADWESDFQALSKDISIISKHKGKVTKSAKNLLDAFNDYYSLEKRLMKLYFYSSMARDLDITNGKYQTMFQKTHELYSNFAAASSFLMPEVMEANEETIRQYIKQEKGLQTYSQTLDNMLRMKKHTLSAKEEELLAKLSPIMSIPNETYGILNDAELPFPSVKDSKGNDIQISHGRFRSALYSNDRDYRKRIYKAYYEPYRQLIGTFASLYNGRLKTRKINAEIRNFSSPLEAALFDDNVPVAVYENLIKATHDNIKLLHRWGEIKKKVMKIDELHPYDTYASLFPSLTKEYTFDEAKEIILKALAPLGEEYQKVLKMSFDNRWIDVYETKGKRSGAYSNGCGCGVHPYILLNWNHTLDDVFTLAHELGHNMHSYFTELKQPYHYANYSIFVAEVASTTNEALLLDYLLENAKTKEEKAALIEKFLLNIQQTFFRQTQFAEFEKITHERALKGEIMTADDLSKLFGDLYQQYWGPSMVTDEEEYISWARIHHLTKYNFYVFQYATGFAAAQAFAENIKKQGKPAIDKYLEFLSSGSSLYGIDVLKRAGVDMTTPEPVNKTLEKMKKYLDELETLLNS